MGEKEREKTEQLYIREIEKCMDVCVRDRKFVQIW